MTLKVFTVVSGLGRAVTLSNTSFCIMICGNNSVQYNTVNRQDLGESHSFLPDNNFIAKSGDSDWTETVTHLERMTTQLTHDIK
jgi:hypothetical protein